MLQRPDRGGRGQPADCDRGSQRPGQRPGPSAPAAGYGAGTLRPHPPTVQAEAGSRNARDLQELETRVIDGYVALGREGLTASARRPQGPATQRRARKLDTPQGQDPYAQRKWLVAAPIGWIKRILGFRQFGMRGLHPVQGEWDLVCRALHVKRLHRLLQH